MQAALSSTSTVVVGKHVPLAEQLGDQARPAHGPAHSLSWCSSCGRPDVDPLTGLLDRWMWQADAGQLLDKFGSSGDPITLLLADLDRFKSINDTAGHAAGDAVLAAIAEVIRSVTRSGDLWARYGSYAGDEFAGLLPGAGLPGAVIVAERLQRHVAAMRLPVSTPWGTREISGLSMSVGLATHTPGHSLDETLKRADLALLSAKRSGRACVCIADASSHVVVASRAGEEQHDER
jgi:diguanylate cyclase (GGDEF)-like protein